MTARPKTIKIFLLDGEPTGIRTAELSNWDGKAIVIPRAKLKEAKERSEVQGAAVYLLIGSEDIKGLSIYVGEAETLFTRLMQHTSDKDFWQYALAFISKSKNLTKAHVKYLEIKLAQLLKSAARCTLINQIAPAITSLPESDMADMNEFAENIELLSGTLGWTVFRKSSEIEKEAERKYYCKGPSASAEGYIDNEGFLVLKNSKARKQLVQSAKNSWIEGLVNSLLGKKVFSDGGDSYIFLEDYLFESPSAAAGAVLARHANGWNEWKTKEGKTLNEIERQELHV